ncbi:MAG: hypothetical protein QOF78_3678 [Phycisphaerales bacterium]|jgi:hypothetical protein|nr:hypothetical protein [Phycisphaerales bacterium]
MSKRPRFPLRRFVPCAALAFAAVAAPASAQVQGPSSSQTPYMTPVAPGVITKSIFTAGDTVGGVKLAGSSDGLGWFDNGNGTFTLLANHEIAAGSGAVRAHGSNGAFVSKWTIDKTTLAVQSGADLVQSVNLWNTTTSAYNAPGTTPFSRFCSADLPAVSAFYNPASGLGTQNRIFLNGEESGAEGRPWGHVATGPDAGKTWELPHTGRFSRENALANPFAQDKTIVIGTNDSATDVGVYMYVGTKTSSGTDVQRAGLVGGTSYALAVPSVLTESRTTAIGAATTFSMASLGNVANTTGVALNTAAKAAGGTTFLRPEDGAWDPVHPDHFYFVTTDRYDQVKDGVGAQVGRSRLWRLRFNDIANPQTGGMIDMLLSGTEAHQMLDNLTVSNGADGVTRLLMTEDVGNQAHNGKVFLYDTSTDGLTTVAMHDPSRFGNIGQPATSPFSQDEEFSGIIDAQSLLGPGWFLVDDMAHYAISDPQVLEGGQLIALYVPQAVPEPTGTLAVMCIGALALRRRGRRHVAVV